jgi:hypothetical protein
VPSAGSRSRIFATRGANDDAYSSVVQSKSSSSSRFSSASLRGLTGHQTAPARAMPKTHANAVGSLPDRTATESPGRTPERTSAPATRRLKSWTSP